MYKQIHCTHSAHTPVTHYPLTTTPFTVRTLSPVHYLPPTTHTQLQFVAPTAEEFDLLQRQLKARLSDGQGETIYEVGVGGELSTVSAASCTVSVCTVTLLVYR